MPGGLMQLVAYGLQDVYLSGKPQITFFKSVYRRHTNFASEQLPNQFNGSLNFGGQPSCQLARTGDLITKMYLKVKLSGLNLNTDSNTPEKKWCWCSKLGHALLKEIEFQVGGTVIDKHYGDWLNVWHEVARQISHDKGYDQMIGNTPELTNLASSHEEATLYIPFQFFFNRHNGLALPLISLQYHDCRIKLTLNNLSSLVCRTANVTDSDLSGLKIISLDLYADYVYLDTEERKRFAQNQGEYLIEQVQFTGEESITQTSASVRLNFNHPIKTIYWGLKLSKYTDSDSRFLAYNPYSSEDIQLTASRRLALRCALYKTAACTEIVAELDARIKYVPSLPNSVVNLLKMLDARVINTNSGNDMDNVSIFGQVLSIQQASLTIQELFGDSTALAYTPVGDKPEPNAYGIENPGNTEKKQDGHPNKDVMVKFFDNYGLYLDRTGNPVISGKLQLNGHDRVEEKEGKYFNYVQPYQHHSRTPSDGINLYSFALEPEKHQPTGSCNFSRIDTANLKLTFDNSIKGDNKLYIFGFGYNVFRVASGMGGLAFAN